VKRDEKPSLMRGSHIVAEAAVRAGCRYYFGYPITPQNELPEYMSKRLPEVGGVFVQAESEIASINMVIGASMVGARVMTSSSSPGISLKQEGISYLGGLELPAVIVNMMRGGPGLGNIAPSQSDYFQATRGGGHGDYRTVVLAPASGQELCDLTYQAFDMADHYRNPVLILADGMMGQMMEPVRFPVLRDVAKLPKKPWAITGAKGRRSHFIRSLILDPGQMEEHNWKLIRKYEQITDSEVRFESFKVDDAKMVIVAFGTAARIARAAVKRARNEGLRVGLFRPITLWPYPSDALRELAKRIKHFFVFELNAGQMIEDVQLAIGGQSDVFFYGRPGGVVPNPAEISRIISRRFFQKEIG